MKLDRKYRVYDRKLKVWAYGDAFFGIFANTLYKDLESAQAHLGDIQEWTGLFDKVGTEIYEGDIVQANAEPEHIEETGVYEVVFNAKDLQYQLRSAGYDHGLPLTWGGWMSLRVIGNVYQNPELRPALSES